MDIIPHSTSHKILKEYTDGPGSVLPGIKSRGVIEVHTHIHTK